MNVDDHTRENGVHFHNLGLATNDNDKFIPVMDSYNYDSTKIWKIKTLKSIKKLLGHEKVSLSSSVVLVNINMTSKKYYFCSDQ